MPNIQFNFQNASDLGNLPTKSQFRKWAKATLRVDTEMTIRIVDEAEGRALNLAYRGKDYATNVLSFPLTEEPCLVGDIIICAPVVIREAKEQHKTVEAHFAHLAVHGTLHLHGYDHLNDDQAGLMESIEVSTLLNLGYPNPYLIT
ncbi:MAG TPA: rRNA maturation RNase YbeY [Methylophilaceae bacterium]|jgi:probable rRNA maturation factor|nr:rRNA maturation RNase YbeY [Methylophilaceae bacterium]